MSTPKFFVDGVLQTDVYVPLTDAPSAQRFIETFAGKFYKLRGVKYVDATSSTTVSVEVGGSTFTFGTQDQVFNYAYWLGGSPSDSSVPDMYFYDLSGSSVAGSTIPLISETNLNKGGAGMYLIAVVDKYQDLTSQEYDSFIQLRIGGMDPSAAYATFNKSMVSSQIMVFKQNVWSAIGAAVGSWNVDVPLTKNGLVYTATGVQMTQGQEYKFRSYNNWQSGGAGGIPDLERDPATERLTLTAGSNMVFMSKTGTYDLTIDFSKPASGFGFTIRFNSVDGYTPIDINIPIEIDAGSFATAVTVQGETVAYNHFNLPLQYQTQSGDATLQDVAQVFQFKEDSVDQTQVVVDVYQSAIGSFANGQAVIKALFKSALDANVLYNIDMTEGPVYADDSARDTSADPVKFYVDKDTHNAGVALGSTLKSYLQEYLYDNLSATIGLAATSGAIDITMSRSGVDASEIIAEALASQICGSSASEQGVAAAALRQNIYEQIFTLAPERFQDSALMRKNTANDAAYKNLPLVPGDSLAFLVTFKFPAAQISAPVIRNAIRTGNSSTYVDTGSKIQVTTAADSTSTTRPNLQDFPNCTVLMRTKLVATGAVPVRVYTRYGPAPSSIPASPASLTSGVIVDNVLTHSKTLSRNWNGSFGGPNIYFRTKAFAHGYIGSSSKVIIRLDGTEYDIDIVERGNWRVSSAVPDPRFFFYDLLERDAAKKAANPDGVSVPSYSKASPNGGDGLYLFVIMENYDTASTYTTVVRRTVAIMKINNYGIRGSAFDGFSAPFKTLTATADPYVFTLSNVTVQPGQFFLSANNRQTGAPSLGVYDGLATFNDAAVDTSIGEIALADPATSGAYLTFSGAAGVYNLTFTVRDPDNVSFEMTPA